MVVKLKRKYVKIYVKGSDMVKKIAVFTDIHGNYEALKSIVEDIKKDNFDEVICLGDLTGIGPSPKECLDLVRKENIKLLLGNHELYQLKGTNIDNSAEHVKEHEAWVKGNYTDDDISYLENCKLTYEFLYKGRMYTFSHFFIEDETKDYPFYNFDILKNMDKIKNLSYENIFIGHEHKPFEVKVNDRLFSCLGSSGCTKSNVTFYTIIELNDDTETIRRKIITYDRKQFEKNFKGKEYPLKGEVGEIFFGIKENKNMVKEKSCGAVVYKIENNNVLYLLVKHNKGHISFSKGHVEKDETEEMTAKREIKEETNIDVSIDKNFRVVRTYSPKENVLKDVILFVGKAENNDVKRQECEIEKVMWLPFDKAFESLTYDTDRDVLEKAKEYLVKNEKI